MIVRFHKAFTKDLSKIKDKATRKKIKKAILKMEKTPSPDKITNLKTFRVKWIKKIFECNHFMGKVSMLSKPRSGRSSAPI
jgi:mRNA-degrading endonuclease RelE of RelBE toxin-antitoxin system